MYKYLKKFNQIKIMNKCIILPTQRLTVLRCVQTPERPPQYLECGPSSTKPFLHVMVQFVANATFSGPEQFSGKIFPFVTCFKGSHFIATSYIHKYKYIYNISKDRTFEI